MPADRSPTVELHDISRRFGPVQALDGARLRAHAGEVHALLGENGAGKSTLLRILAGLERPDAGTIRIEGVERRLSTAREAWRAGVGMVHQHFSLVQRMSVLENLALGLRTRGGFTFDRRQLAQRANELAEETGLAVPLDAAVEHLGVGDRQRVEILRVLLRTPRILVLDEPTAVLAPAEVERLFALLRRLAAQGTAVLLVAHKLDEVLSVGERFTVLRAGRTVLERTHAEVDAQVLAEAMLGPERLAPGRLAPGNRAPAEPRSSAPHAPGSPVAELSDVTCAPLRQGSGLRGVDLEVRAGEVLGIAGVEGNGQHELARVLAGRLIPESGHHRVAEEPAYIPGDRGDEGLIGDFTLSENLALRLHRFDAWLRGPWLRWPRIRAATSEALDRFSVRAPGPQALARTLSGGNQQRVIVARELTGGPRLVVAENPTRGLDLAAASAVHRALREHVEQSSGRAVVLISNDLDEVLAHADRICVAVRGRLIEVPAHERTREAVGRRMLATTETPPPRPATHP